VRIDKVLFVISFLILTLASQVHARVFYVSTSGSDTPSGGSFSTPWRTIGYSTMYLRAGDTVYVRGGVYHEVLNPTYSGTPGAHIVFSAYPGEFVQVDGPLDAKHEVVTQWKSYITIQGFTFKDQDFLLAPGQPTYWISLSGSDVIFRNNRVVADGNAYTNVYTHNELSRGIVVGGPNITVENCFVRGLDLGIVVAGFSPRYVVLRHDTVYATNASNVAVQSTAGLTTDYHATLIEYCVLDTSWTEDNIQFEHDYSNPTSTLYNRGTIVRRTRCGNAAENAIDLKGTEHIVLENNLLYSAAGDDNGPLGGNDLGSGSGLVSKSPGSVTRKTVVRFNLIFDNMSGAVMTEGDLYYNNTFVNNRRTWKGPNQADNSLFGFIAWSEVGADRAFVNNIIAGQPNRATVQFALDGTGGKFYLNNNLYYDGVSAAKFYHRVSGSYITTEGIQSWKTVLATYSGYSSMGGKDDASIEGDPQFVNAPAYPAGFSPLWDFGLRSTSPAIDAGRAVAVAQTSGSGSTSMVVDNAYYFCDGFGITSGDLIRIGGGPSVQIVSINYGTNTITLAEPRTWVGGVGVHVAFDGNAPDIGAKESGFSGTTLPAPFLSSPVDGAIGLSAQVQLTWIASPGAVSYDLQVAADATFVNLYLTGTGVTSTSHLLTGLAEGGTYYWRVRARSSAGTSAWSEGSSFSVARMSMALQYNKGWNLLSIPLTPGDSTVAAIFPGAISSAFTFDELYVDSPTLSIAKGYWLKLSSATAVALRGQPPLSRDIKVKKGWNLIGGLDSDAPTAGVTSVPAGIMKSMFFGFDSSYTPAVYLTSGKGYWINTADSGILHLPATMTKPGAYTGAVNDSWVRLDFSDAAGGHTTLYLSPPDRMPEYAILPPLPPAGTFDARFVGDHYVEPFGGVHSVQLAATAWPLRISCWNAGGTRLRIKGAVSGTIVDQLLEEGNEVIVRGEPGTLTIDDGAVPEGFELHQNYPNPFNPTTVVSYQLPMASDVQLVVFDMLGREVSVLVNERREAGYHQAQFDGSGLSSGVYVCQMRAGSFLQAKRLLLIR
jgi:hypothetical protein